MHALLSAWENFPSEQRPYVLPGDEILLENPRLYCRYDGWNGFVSDPECGAPGHSRLHLDLLPIPFVGNLKTASVFLLMLNPGFGPHDYFGEYAIPEYRVTLLENLRQTRSNSFFFLDPRFSWHGGYGYWHAKLRDVIVAFSKSVGISYGRGRQFFQSHIACIKSHTPILRQPSCDVMTSRSANHPECQLPLT